MTDERNAARDLRIIAAEEQCRAAVEETRQLAAQNKELKEALQRLSEFINYIDDGYGGSIFEWGGEDPRSIIAKALELI